MIPACVICYPCQTPIVLSQVLFCPASPAGCITVSQASTLGVAKIPYVKLLMVLFVLYSSGGDFCTVASKMCCGQ